MIIYGKVVVNHINIIMKSPENQAVMVFYLFGICLAFNILNQDGLFLVTIFFEKFVCLQVIGTK